MNCGDHLYQPHTLGSSAKWASQNEKTPVFWIHPNHPIHILNGDRYGYLGGLVRYHVLAEELVKLTPESRLCGDSVKNRYEKEANHSKVDYISCGGSTRPHSIH